MAGWGQTVGALLQHGVSWKEQKPAIVGGAVAACLCVTAHSAAHRGSVSHGTACMERVRTPGTIGFLRVLPFRPNPIACCRRCCANFSRWHLRRPRWLSALFQPWEPKTDCDWAFLAAAAGDPPARHLSRELPHPAPLQPTGSSWCHCIWLQSARRCVPRVARAA